MRAAGHEHAYARAHATGRGAREAVRDRWQWAGGGIDRGCTHTVRTRAGPGPSGFVGDFMETVAGPAPVDEPPPLPPNASLKVIGQPISRFDGVQKVTGKARYTFDVQLPNM